MHRLNIGNFCNFSILGKDTVGHPGGDFSNRV